MHRRLSQVDSELTTAKRRLSILEQSCEVATVTMETETCSPVPWHDLIISVSLCSSLKRLNLENCKLKTQLEDYKAEAALKTIQASFPFF